MGNIKANSIWEGKLSDDTLRPTPESDMNFRTKFIEAKYRDEKYLDRIGLDRDLLFRSKLSFFFKKKNS